MQPKIYSAREHGISRDAVSSDALRVIDTLQDAGYEAYLVGGGVRDLLTGKSPKDFDISTSARPEEVKRLFRRNCVLIGRRFRLAHVRFGNHILEVSTFRAGDPTEGELIVRDNTWGTAEEDALRRDFTINALYYDPSEETIIDYVDGVVDLENHLLRTIGDPSLRFTQDPVRMLRALKFVARFGFKIDAPTLESMKSCHQEIIKSSPARLLEETFRMLESGAAEPFFRLMYEHGMLQLLYPWLTPVLEGKYGEDVFTFLKAADQMNQERERPLTRATLGCCLIFPILDYEIRSQVVDAGIVPRISLLMELAAALLHGIVTSSFADIPRRIRTSMQAALHMQYRLTPLMPLKIRKDRVARSKDFFYACELLEVRSRIDDSLVPTYEEWSDYQKEEPVSVSRRPRRRRRRKPPGRE